MTLQKWLLYLCALVVSLTLSVASADTTVSEDTLQADFSYVPPDAVFAAVLRPQWIISARQTEVLPVEVMAALVKHEIGIDFRCVEHVVSIVERPPGHSPACSVFIRFNRPFDWRQLPRKLAERTVFDRLEGRPYRRGRDSTSHGIYMPDERTLIVARHDAVRRMLASHGQRIDSLVVDALIQNTIQFDLHAAVSTQGMLDLVISAMDQQVLNLPSVLRLLECLQHVDKFELRARASKGPVVGIVMRTSDAAAAQELNDAVADVLHDVPRLISRQEADSEDESSIEMARQQYISRVALMLAQRMKVRRRGNQVALVTTGNSTDQVAASAAVSMMLLPAIEATCQTARHLQTLRVEQPIPAVMTGLRHQMDKETK